MRDYLYDGNVRLDWGFGNPNVTGSLIALIMLAAWLLAHLPRRWGHAGFIVALASNAVLGLFMIQTFSRGAAVALIAGAVPLLTFAVRPWRRWKWLAVLLTVLCLSGYAVHLGFSDRTLHGISGEDKSVTNRWLIYTNVPRMTWDAPEGWGHNRGAEAFRQWYQPLGRTESYGRLVSSHATWLVEWPWYLRVVYVVGWALVLLLCLPTERYRLAEVIGVWIAFGIGASFTTIAHNWLLWIVPAIAFFVMLIARTVQKSWPSRRQCTGTILIVLGVCIIWWAWALATTSQVSMKQGVVSVKQHTSQTTVLLPGLDETVMGRFYGHRIRELCLKEPLQISFRWRPESQSLPEAEVCVLAGKVAGQVSVSDMKSLNRTRRFLFLNPNPPSEPLLKLLESPSCPAIALYQGSFAGGSGLFFWQALAAKRPHLFKVEKVQGSGRFLRDWSSINFTP